MVFSLVRLDSAVENEVTIGGTAQMGTRFSEAVRDGRAYTAASKAVPINSQRFLNIRFENPAGSGKNCFFVARKLGANRAGDQRPLMYGFIVSPVTLTNAISITGNNRFTGGAASSMSVTYNEASARLDSNPPTVDPGQGFLPNNGLLLNVDDEARNWLAEHGYDEKMGARPMARLVQLYSLIAGSLLS